MVIAVATIAVVLSPSAMVTLPTTATGAASVGAAAAGEGAVGSLGTTALATITGATTTVAVGLIILGIVGADRDEPKGLFTWDCWKHVVHDESPEPSQGMPLAELLSHPACTHIAFDEQSGRVLIENVYSERFELSSVHVPGHGLCWHANKLAEAGS
jgi:hypothetical protein